MVEVDDEDLAVADLAGFGSRGDSVDGLVDLVRGDSDLDLDLGQEAHGIFGAAIDFGMTLLSAISFDFRHRETMNANGGQGVTDFFELEWLDDRHNNFHGSYPRFGPAWTNPALSTEVHHAGIGPMKIVIAIIKPFKLDRKSTRLNSSHTEIYTLSLHDALPIFTVRP